MLVHARSGYCVGQGHTGAVRHRDVQLPVVTSIFSFAPAKETRDPATDATTTDRHDAKHDAGRFALHVVSHIAVGVSCVAGVAGVSLVCVVSCVAGVWLVCGWCVAVCGWCVAGGCGWWVTGVCRWCVSLVCVAGVWLVCGWCVTGVCRVS